MNTSTLEHGYHCVTCDWPVIFSCCNDEFTNFKDAKNWDWWLYCTNKGCKNHDGEGIWQNIPNWVDRVSSDDFTQLT